MQYQFYYMEISYRKRTIKVKENQRERQREMEAF